MNLHTYQPHELRFAFCYRVYFCLRTYRGHPISLLTELQRATLDALLGLYNVRVLECATNETDLRCIASLQPVEAISGCASKLKGRVSKWLREGLKLPHAAPTLSKGYFACTTGRARSKVVERYLILQAEHHPSLSPASIAAVLMNSAQEVVKEELIQARVERLWMTRAYFGSYGDLSSPQLRKFIENWKEN